MVTVSGLGGTLCQARPFLTPEAQDFEPATRLFLMARKTIKDVRSHDSTASPSTRGWTSGRDRACGSLEGVVVGARRTGDPNVALPAD
jgi:hypothetical protein